MANKNIPSEKTSNVTKKHGFNVNFIRNSLGRLNSVIENLPRFVQDEFISEYGDIIYIPLIEVEEPAIKTLIQFWNVKLGVFELPHIDTTPTLEEYQKLLGLFQLDKIYYQGLPTKEEEVLKLLDIKDNPGKRTTQKPFSGLKQKPLEDHLVHHVENHQWVFARPVLAFLIYGLVLFPSTQGMVDTAAIDVFYKVSKMGSPWYKDDTVLMACGSFSGVPLIGPRSSFLYFPCLVLRQMGWTQTFPEGEIESFCLEGEEGRTKESEFLQAWKNMKMLGAKELQQQIKTEVASYVAWRKARTENFTPLIPFPKNSGPTSKEQALQKKTEVLEAQLKATQTEKREIETIFSAYDREKVHLKRKIKDLEKENHTSTEASKRKMEDNLEEEIKSLTDQLRIKDVALNNSVQKCKGLINQIRELRQKNSHQKMNLLEMEKIVKDRDEEIRLLEKLMNCIKKEQLQDEETWKRARER
ncbi:hypothetical protein RIF29_00827 [Crotalaria pallida]|uniref:DUF7745 domain-containing protein n=1 Tax=Crotalaria pallida TaxID=3830 RepID=A0AAN9IX08_CROPI